jgi:hypothetical protein
MIPTLVLFYLTQLIIIFTRETERVHIFNNSRKIKKLKYFHKYDI